MSFSEKALELSAAIVGTATAKGLTVATAESCTGGLIAGCLTEVSGASAVLTYGFIAYANAAKTDLLGVSAEVLERSGAVSEETAWAMAEGALRRAGADVAVSVTGIAGPGGATPTKPVGLVHGAVARDGGETLQFSEVFPGDRRAIRIQAMEAALALLLRQVEAASGRNRGGPANP